MEGDRHMAFASPDCGAVKAYFDVGCRLEADLLQVIPGVVRIRVPLQAADEKLIAKRPGQTGQQGHIERLGAVDLEGVDVLGIVAVEEASALSGGEPVVALAEGELVVEEAIGDIGLDDAEDIGGRDWAFGNRRLHRIACDGNQCRCSRGSKRARGSSPLLKARADTPYAHTS